MNGIFGQSAGLNVVLPQQGGYAPATKEAIGAATGGNIQIPEYDVAQGMAETEPYYGTVAKFREFLASARERGVDPAVPQIGNQESILANQVYRKYIDKVNREGALLAEAKKTKGDLMRGNYEIPAGTDNSATTLIQSAPNAMKKDAISPVAATFVRAIQNDTITADNVERYEAAREQAKAQVAGEAERLLQENYSQGQVDQYISRSLAALDIPLNVKQGQDGLAIARYNLDLAKFNRELTKEQDGIKGILTTIPTGGFTVEGDTPSGRKPLTAIDGFTFSRKQVRGVGSSVKPLTKDGELLSKTSDARYEFDRFAIVPINTKTGKPVSGSPEAIAKMADVEYKPVLVGDAIVRNEQSKANEYFPVILDASGANAGFANISGMSADEREAYRLLATSMTDHYSKGNIKKAEKSAPTQSAPIATKGTLSGGTPR